MLLCGITVFGDVMVKSLIDLSERESRIINIVKAKYGLKDKSQALSIILKRYEECELEPYGSNANGDANGQYRDIEALGRSDDGQAAQSVEDGSPHSAHAVSGRHA